MLGVRHRAGDWVEVRSAAEILATLDRDGCLEALPFMPEMLQYCGKRFRVYKSAHKACDTLKTHRVRTMARAVHLEGLRCDGSAHGGCQAGCLLYWKEAWLKAVPGPCPSGSARAASAPPPAGPDGDAEVRQDDSALARTVRVRDGGGEDVYRCQATEMFRATAPVGRWDIRPYLRDLVSGNVRPLDFVRYVLLAAYNAIMRLHWRLRPYPYVCGRAEGRTPTARLDLRAGEWVEVRSRDEIMETLVRGGNRNRGLSYDVEMVPFCGRRFRVLRRVERIIDEKTGKLVRIPGSCVILDGAVCSGNLSKDRLFCPRSIYPFWHEVWLKRAAEPSAAAPRGS